MVIRAGNWLAALALATILVPVKAETVVEPDNFAARYPAGSIKSVEQADAALAEAEKARAAIQARFIEQEKACLPKFLVSPCVEQAKEAQRKALSSLRPAEVEAARFKRQAKADEHDKSLLERAQQEKLSMPHHQQQQEDFEKNQAKREAERLKNEQATAAAAAENDAKIAAAEQRKAAQEAKLKRVRAKQAEEAPKRAANVAAFNQKQEAAKVRQAERAAQAQAKSRASASASAAASANVSSASTK